MNNSNWQGQFAQGFVSSGGGGDGALWAVAIVVLALVAIAGLYTMMNKTSKPRSSGPRPAARLEADRVQPSVGKPIPVANKINPLQQRILHEIIDEFRQHESLAQSVPVAVLEKYSEYLYANVKRLKTNETDVREFVNMHFPIKEGYGVELDFQASGVMQLIKSKVLEVGAKTITIGYDGQVLAFMKRGNQVILNYNAGKHFLQGATTIAEIKPSYGIVLRKPQHIALTSERRYSRMNLRNVFGTIEDTQRNYRTTVRVMDLSLEGVRIQVEKPLEKRHVHQLAFDVTMEGKPLTLGPVDCVPSKAFFTGSGTYESGLVFLYLDAATRTRLTTYMKFLAQELQDARVARGGT